MVDDSEMDYIVTFLGKVHATGTTKSEESAGGLMDAQNYTTATSRIFVQAPQGMGSFSNVVIKRFRLQVHEASEKLFMTLINNIITGCLKLNTRQTITDYTRPASFIHAEYMSSQVQERKKDYILGEIVLDCNFTTS